MSINNERVFGSDCVDTCKATDNKTVIKERLGLQAKVEEMHKNASASIENRPCL